jgi:acetyl-CoA carboxylase biotin carboxyl carrier protein
MDASGDGQLYCRVNQETLLEARIGRTTSLLEGSDRFSMPENQKRIRTEFIKELAELLSSSDLTEIELEQESFKLRLKREVSHPVVSAPAAPIAPAAPVAVVAAPAAAPVAAAPAAEPEDSAHPGAVRSPMVGTVYLSAEPGGKEFIDVGTQVVEGQTLMIIEAMKHMNQIASTKSGTVAKICVENSDPVEYDQVLVIIE